MKYAELPGGKILKFPDEASEKDITRAVRRELGLAHDDFLDALETHVAELVKHSEKQDKRHRETLEEVTDAFNSNASRIAAEISEAARSIEKAHVRLSADILKALNNQVQLVTKLHVAVQSLDKTLDAALGQSLEALDRANGISAGIAKSIEATGSKLADVSQRLSKEIATLDGLAKIRKRATRHRDGTWTLEAERAQ